VRVHIPPMASSEFLVFTDALFSKKIRFLRDHVRTVPGNMRVKFEDRSFNRFKLV